MSQDLKIDGGVDAGGDGIPPVCQTLKEARLQRGMSLADVANALKLTQRQVEAMETGQFESLPGAAFVRGFLRNYCRFLDLDAETLLKDMQSGGRAKAVNLAPVSNAEGVMPARGGRPGSSAKPLMVVALLLVIAIGVGAYFDWFQTGHEPAAVVSPAVLTPEAATPVPAPVTPAEGGGLLLTPPKMEVIKPDAVPAQPTPAVTPPGKLVPPASAPQGAASAPHAAVAPAVSEGAASSTPTDGKARLEFKFSAESWVEVRDAVGAIVYSGVNGPGVFKEVLARPPLSLVVGNAGSVVLTRDGKVIELNPVGRSAVARVTLQ